MGEYLYQFARTDINKLQTRWFKTSEIHCLRVQEARTLKSRCGQSCIPSAGSREGSFLAPSSFRWLQASLGLWLNHSGLCLCLHTAFWHLNHCWCVCVCTCACAQLGLTRCDPTDCSPSGSSVHGIFQACILEWVAISSPRGSPLPRDQTCIPFLSYISDRLCTAEPPGTLPFALFLLFPCKDT